MTSRNLESADASKRGRYAPWFNSVTHDWFVNFSERKRIFGDREHLTPEEEVILVEAIKARRKVSIVIHPDTSRSLLTTKSSNWRTGFTIIATPHGRRVPLPTQPLPCSGRVAASGPLSRGRSTAVSTTETSRRPSCRRSLSRLPLSSAGT